MKRKLFTLALSMFCCLTATSFAEDKIYLNSKEVLIAENGIFINVDGYIGVVDTLKHDEDGLYIEPKANWICVNGHIVLPWQGTTCPRCGAHCN